MDAKKEQMSQDVLSKPFKKLYTFEQRKTNSKKQISNYPQMVPIILERYKKSKLNLLPQKKFLVNEMTKFYEFQQVVKDKLDQSTSEDSIFIYVNGKLINDQFNLTMQDLYSVHKDADGFLYMEYNEQQTFGGI